MHESTPLMKRILLGYPLAFSVALVCGATSVLESWLPAVALIGIAVVVASFKRPAVAILLAFSGILLDARGVTSVQVLGLPLTASKVLVVFALGAFFVNCTVRRRQLFSMTPVTFGLVAVVGTMLLSLVAAVDPSWGYAETAGVIMLTVMLHLVYRAIEAEDIPWMIRAMSTMTVIVLAWTLATQRKQAFFVTLDHAWQQRTSGAYGDPNAWCTALLVLCPILLGGLERDKHWSAMPLLLALGITFPACVVQSMSRAGLLTLFLISPGLVFMLRRRKGLLIAAGVAIIGMMPFIINIDAVILRYRTLLDPTLEADLGHASLRERKALLAAGLHIFQEHPVTGVGVGLFRLYASYVSAGEVWKIAHNTYVNVAAEQGVPGLFSHAWLGIQVLASGWNAMNRSVTEYGRGIGLGMFCSICAFALMAATLNLATFAMAWFMLAFGLASARSFGAEHGFDQTERREQLHDATEAVAA